MRLYFGTIFAHQWFVSIFVIVLTIILGGTAFGQNGNPAESPLDPSPIIVEMEKHPNALQGHYSPVDIRLHSGQDRITGFSFLVAYDTTQLRLKLAEPGGFLKGRGWANFSVEPAVAGQSDSVSRLCFLRVTGSIGDGVPLDSAQMLSHVLARLVFFVSDSPRLACQFLPVRFCWSTCEDNIVFGGSDKTSHYAQSIINTEIGWEDKYDLPGDCFLDVKKTPPTPAPCRDEDSLSSRHAVIYIDGGIEVVCAVHNSCVLGDVNFNGIPSEMNDLFALARLLVYGCFCPYLSDSIQTVVGMVPRSEYGGSSISIGSLVFLNRVIIGDYLPNLPGAHDSIVFAAEVRKDSLSLLTRSSARIGAQMLTFDCDTALTLPLTSAQAFGVHVEYACHDGRLCLLVYPVGRDFLPVGKQTLGTMRLPGLKRLIEAEAVDYYGRPVRTIIKKHL